MSKRGFSATIEAALASPDAPFAYLVMLDWPSGPVRMWTGSGNLVWNSQTWIGAGSLANIDSVTDSVDKSDVGVELTLNYLNDDLRNEINTTKPVGRDASITLALMNPATGSVIDADPDFFVGFIDKIEILDAGSEGKISVRLASELARLQRARFFALSDAHQQFLFAGDKGCEFATHMSETIYWGRKPVTPLLNIPFNGGYDNWGPTDGPILP